MIRFMTPDMYLRMIKIWQTPMFIDAIALFGSLL